jgi:antitoxin YefM
MLLMLAFNATDVRKEWGGFLDSIVREKPKFIKRSRDYIFTSNLPMLNTMLAAYNFTADLYFENNGSITASLKEIDIVVNGNNEETALNLLAEDLLEYAKEYYESFEKYFNSVNRKSHYPYILKILILEDVERIKGIIKCQNGKR